MELLLLISIRWVLLIVYITGDTINLGHRISINIVLTRFEILPEKFLPISFWVRFVLDWLLFQIIRWTILGDFKGILRVVREILRILHSIVGWVRKRTMIWHLRRIKRNRWYVLLFEVLNLWHILTMCEPESISILYSWGSLYNLLQLLS